MAKGTKRKKKHVLSTILLVIALGVFIFALYKIISGRLEYKKGRDEYEKIRDDAQTDQGNGINWDALRAVNPDIVAWIRFDEPKVIDYPVVQGKDNDEYLHRSFGENYIKAGTIFVNYANKKDFTDRNTFVYGHNMNDGSMFASLRQYQEKEFYDKYPHFYILTPDGKTHRYLIFAAGDYNRLSDAATQYEFADDEDFMDFIKEIKQGQYYETGVEIFKDDHVVALYTCTNVRESERRIVYGVEDKVE